MFCKLTTPAEVLSGSVDALIQEDTPSTADSVVPAAQYLRMSTEHQQYSLANQCTVIDKYAQSQGFVVVRAYSDQAMSGLVLREGVNIH
jgi:hypothetical protein